MADFAKLFKTKKHGQILVMLTRDDEGDPAIRFFCQPEDLGVCMVGFSFADTDEGWDKAEKAFAEYNLDRVVDVIDSIPGFKFSGSTAEATES